MKVGIPCMKCALKPSQQVNKKTGKRSKTCGLRSAWEEMNDQRIGRDPTIDKEMTHLNVWMEGSSDLDIEGIVKKEIERIDMERKANGKRALRSDTVSTIQIVEKPNMSYMEDLSYEERKQFLNTSHEVMKSLIHDWNPHWKILAACQHHDEFGGLSAHNHTLIMVSTIDKEGLPSMNAKAEFNLKFFNFLNKNYSVRMQERGYEVENVRTFDQLSEEEKMERKLKPQEHGVDAYIYKKKKMDEMDQSIKELNQKQKTLSSQLEETVKEITEAPDLESYKTVVHENETLRNELALKDRIIEKLQTEVEALKTKLESWKKKFTDISQKAGSKLMRLFGYDVDENTIHHDLPNSEILDGLNQLQGKLETYDISKFRVVPDDQNSGKYRIVYRDSNQNLKIYERNIPTRQMAENKIRELKIHVKLKKPDIKLNLKK